MEHHIKQTDVSVVNEVLDLCLAVANTADDNIDLQEFLFAKLDLLLEEITPDDLEQILAASAFKKIKDRLHNRRAMYEYAREVLLADDIIKTGKAEVAEEFRSHNWYDKALDFETNALAPYNLKRILFVGSGPYPTSPMAFQRNNPDARVTCMDRSKEACKQAKEVACIFDLPQMEVLNLDGAQETDFTAYDCVIVGLVVGAIDEEKTTIVEHFLNHVPNNTLLCFRSATGSGQVIYPSVDLTELAGLNVEVLEGPPHKSFTLVIVKR